MVVICFLFCYRASCLQAGAHVIGGPPCSSWVWLSRGSTKRCRLRPQGSKLHAGVKRSNKLARRLLYLKLVSTNSNAWWHPSMCMCYFCPIYFVACVACFEARSSSQARLLLDNRAATLIPAGGLQTLQGKGCSSSCIIFFSYSTYIYLLKFARRRSRGTGQSLFTFPWGPWGPQRWTLSA